LAIRVIFFGHRLQIEWQPHNLPGQQTVIGFRLAAIDPDQPVTQHPLDRALRQPRHKPPQKPVKTAIILVRRHCLKTPLHRFFLYRPSHSSAQSYLCNGVVIATAQAV